MLITGPRQVGKTTLLKKLSDNNRKYVTLDDPMLRALAKSDPALFIQRYTPPIIIDEIQYAPELLPYIKMQVDSNKIYGSYWIIGSQMFHLMNNVSESLAGRVGIINMIGLSILVSSGIITLIEPYFNNALKRIIKAPNMYFLDTGLCAYLTRWTSAEALEAGAMSGAFFETYVVSEIIKSYYNAGKRPPIFYYRDSDNKELDLILFENNTLYPIEIKKSSNPKKDAIRHFSILEKTKLNIGEGNVICFTTEIIPIDFKNHTVPVWLI